MIDSCLFRDWMIRVGEKDRIEITIVGACCINGRSKHGSGPVRPKPWRVGHAVKSQNQISAS